MSNTAYAGLRDRFRRLSLLGDAAAVLHWDSAAMMPPGGAPARAAQLANLAEVRHTLLFAPDMGELLAAAEAGRDPLDQANLRRREHLWGPSTADTRRAGGDERVRSGCA